MSLPGTAQIQAAGPLRTMSSVYNWPSYLSLTEAQKRQILEWSDANTAYYAVSRFPKEFVGIKISLKQCLDIVKNYEEFGERSLEDGFSREMNKDAVLRSQICDVFRENPKKTKKEIVQQFGTSMKTLNKMMKEFRIKGLHGKEDLDDMPLNMRLNKEKKVPIRKRKLETDSVPVPIPKKKSKSNKTTQITEVSPRPGTSNVKVRGHGKKMMEKPRVGQIKKLASGVIDENNETVKPVDKPVCRGRKTMKTVGGAGVKGNSKISNSEKVPVKPIRRRRGRVAKSNPTEGNNESSTPDVNVTANDTNDMGINDESIKTTNSTSEEATVKVANGSKGKNVSVKPSSSNASSLLDVPSNDSQKAKVKVAVEKWKIMNKEMKIFSRTKSSTGRGKKKNGKLAEVDGKSTGHMAAFVALQTKVKKQIRCRIGPKRKFTDKGSLRRKKTKGGKLIRIRSNSPPIEPPERRSSFSCKSIGGRSRTFSESRNDPIELGQNELGLTQDGNLNKDPIKMAVNFNNANSRPQLFHLVSPVSYDEPDDPYLAPTDDFIDILPENSHPAAKGSNLDESEELLDLEEPVDPPNYPFKQFGSTIIQSGLDGDHRSVIREIFPADFFASNLSKLFPKKICEPQPRSSSIKSSSKKVKVVKREKKVIHIHERTPKPRKSDWAVKLPKGHRRRVREEKLERLERLKKLKLLNPPKRISSEKRRGKSTKKRRRLIDSNVNKSTVDESNNIQETQETSATSAPPAPIEGLEKEYILVSFDDGDGVQERLVEVVNLEEFGYEVLNDCVEVMNVEVSTEPDVSDNQELVYVDYQIVNEEDVGSNMMSIENVELNEVNGQAEELASADHEEIDWNSLNAQELLAIQDGDNVFDMEALINAGVAVSTESDNTNDEETNEMTMSLSLDIGSEVEIGSELAISVQHPDINTD